MRETELSWLFWMEKERNSKKGERRRCEYEILIDVQNEMKCKAETEQNDRQSRRRAE
jgi:hypothetical protein